jgi:DNA polymerase III alpha subunit
MIALFKSHSSILRSILTLDSPENDRDPDLPDSIIDIALNGKLKELVLVEDTMSSFLQANVACRKAGLKLIFGYRVSFYGNLEDKQEESHKNIIFAKNKAGYNKLIELATFAAYNNFEKEARLTYENLHSFWDDNLALAIPFYDSFLHKNLLCGGMCIPDFGNIKPTLFIEDNNIPFDYLIRDSVLNYSSKFGFKTENAKSIYYKNRDDFEAFMTLKCLNRKMFGSGRTLECPNFDHLSSSEFCWESYVEKINE